jgi:hypothetical protein
MGKGDGFFDWRDTKISKWRRVLRLILAHSWKDNIRGYTAEESARLVLIKHNKRLTKEEKKFLEETYKGLK